MPPLPLLVALLAAGVGALAWAAVSRFSGYEVGYVAWAIGGLVGLATVRFGGRGVACASVAAVLTVAGIVGGKLLGTRLVVEHELEQAWQTAYTPQLHAELLVDAADFAELSAREGDEPGEDALRLFLVEHRYTRAESPARVSPEELQGFRSEDAPSLRALQAERPDFEDWFAASVAHSRQSFEQEFSVVQANLDELNGFDALFVVLGVSTAFGIVRRAGQATPGSSEGQRLPEDQDARRAA